MDLFESSTRISLRHLLSNKFLCELFTILEEIDFIIYAGGAKTSLVYRTYLKKLWQNHFNGFLPIKSRCTIINVKTTVTFKIKSMKYLTTKLKALLMWKLTLKLPLTIALGSYLGPSQTSMI